MSGKFTWATVTQASPLRVQLDGDTAPLPITPDSLIDPLDLIPNDRVRVEVSRGKVIVHGRSGAPAQRQITWTTTSAVAAGAEVELTITLPRVCDFERLVTSAAARVRVYDRAAKSTADASRVSGVLPTGDHGLLIELDGGSAAEDITWNPRVTFTNRDNATTYKMRVKNLSGSSTVITGSLYVV